MPSPSGSAVSLEPRLAGDQHLRAQPQLASGLDVLDAPPVDGVADDEGLGVASAAVVARSPEDLVGQPADHPRGGQGVPAVLGADALDDRPHSLGRRLARARPVVDVDGATGPVRVARQGLVGLARRRPGPGRLDLTVLDLAERETHGVPVPRQPGLGGRDDVVDVVLLRDGVVLERLDQRHGHRVRDGRDQRDPPPGEHRGRDGQGVDASVRQTRLVAVAVHQSGVGQDVARPDVEGAVDVGVDQRGVHQVVQDVADRDRLDLVLDPARGGHQRDVLREVTDHLEGRRARADDDSGLEHDRGDRAVEEDLAHGRPRAHVRRQLDALGVQSAEVDQAGDPGAFCGVGDELGGVALLLFEV